MRTPKSHVAAVVVAVALSAAATGCSSGDDGGGDDEPGQLRIDGPAEVDPDFDPFATVPPTAPADDGG